LLRVVLLLKYINNKVVSSEQRVNWGY